MDNEIRGNDILIINCILAPYPPYINKGQDFYNNLK